MWKEVGSLKGNINSFEELLDAFIVNLFSEPKCSGFVLGALDIIVFRPSNFLMHQMWRVYNDGFIEPFLMEVSWHFNKFGGVLKIFFNLSIKARPDQFMAFLN